MVENAPPTCPGSDLAQLTPVPACFLEVGHIGRIGALFLGGYRPILGRFTLSFGSVCVPTNKRGNLFVMSFRFPLTPHKKGLPIFGKHPCRVESTYLALSPNRRTPPKWVVSLYSRPKTGYCKTRTPHVLPWLAQKKSKLRVYHFSHGLPKSRDFQKVSEVEDAHTPPLPERLLAAQDRLRAGRKSPAELEKQNTTNQANNKRGS